MESLNNLLKTDFPWVADGTARRLEIYLKSLKKWNRAINLTGIPEREWPDRIVAESLMLVDLIPAGVSEASDAAIWMDMGTGAGIPGLIIASACPQQRILLVDSRLKKVDFLDQAARAMGLKHVEPVCERLENLCNVQPVLNHGIQVFFSRALADIETLVSYARPFSTDQSVLIVPISGRVQKKNVNFPLFDQNKRFGRIEIRTVPGSERRIQCAVVNIARTR